MRQALDTPWKIWNHVAKWLSYPRARLLCAWNGIPWGRKWQLFGVPIIQRHRRSEMSLGDGLCLRSSAGSNPLAPNHQVVLATWQAGAVLRIGRDFAMTGGTICAANRIEIGDRVVIGANTTIVDTDFHPLDAEERRLAPAAGKASPICIEDDVFVGMSCLILKGVTIGRGSVVGAGSVVTRDVPPATIVAGNPAKVVGSVSQR